jgi:CII-binding regulator of phage lambda lysogenization HflD
LVETAVKRPFSSGYASNILRMLAYKSVVALYRIFAIVTLYAVLFGVLGYGFIMGFYAINSSWAAPVILSPADDKTLDFTQKLVTSTQTLEDLALDKKRLESSASEMTHHRSSLLALEPELQRAIARESSHNRATGPQLSQLNRQKQADNAKSDALLTQVQALEADIDKDLAAGLITKGDAGSQRVALNQAQTSFTDSRISQVLLTDTILDKTTTNTKSLDVLDKQAELKSEIAQLDIALNLAEKQIREESQQIDRLKTAIATAKQTPYYLSVSGGSTIYFAFVPYDNERSVAAGSPVYDCYLNMLACRAVGTVKRIFTGEEHAIHPIFRSDMRGFMIQLKLKHPESAKSKTIFLNRKPLFF